MEQKRVGIVGLGSMGGNVARVLSKKGYSLVLYNRSSGKYKEFEGIGDVQFASDIGDLAAKLRSGGRPAVVWIMVPAGAATNGVVDELSKQLGRGDIVIDASNSIYVDSIANCERLKAKEISFLDVGCAGGPDDVLNGVALMVGGDRKAFEAVKDVLKAVCGNGAYGYVGGSGAGHMTKLVHNGIFYGIFPVYAEGIELLLRLKDESKGYDIGEALRLLKACPPINAGIMKAISEAYEKGALSGEAAPMKVSEMVRWETEKARKVNVGLTITNAILAGYSSMSDASRRIYSSAKKILTGH